MPSLFTFLAIFIKFFKINYQCQFLSKYNFIEVGLAGHPEGHPEVSKEKLDEAIIKKNKFAKNVDF